ncbi:hypothetical protein RI367_008761 [Sorochytrium milnesiophthora]
MSANQHPLLAPSTLTTPTGRILLEPLDINRHAKQLFDASSVQNVTKDCHPVFRYFTYGPFASLEEYTLWLQERILADPRILAFAVLTNVEPDGRTGLANGTRVVGFVTYLAVYPEHKRLEIGHIWYAPSYQRTFLGTEVLYTLIRHAFEELRYNRVEWKCDTKNAASRGAAERLGFTYEGTFRKHMVSSAGVARDTAYLAIIDDDWPAVKQSIERKMDRHAV